MCFGLVLKQAGKVCKQSQIYMSVLQTWLNDIIGILLLLLLPMIIMTTRRRRRRRRRKFCMLQTQVGTQLQNNMRTGLNFVFVVKYILNLSS